MSCELLLRETALRFPRYASEGASITKLQKGGSDRSFYRIRIGDGDSLILVEYGESRPENALYAPLAEFLRKLGVRVPRIYGHEPKRGLLWMEDLGDRDLWAYRALPWEERRRLYFAALHEVFLLHANAPPRVEGIVLQPPFTCDLYAWEQSYFFENCLGRFFQGEGQTLRRLAKEPALREIAERLSLFPRRLVHRDFQSQNVLVRDGEVYLIDFQGMRPGLASYDLASLLFDPYVALSADRRAELKEYYASLWKASGRSMPEDLTEAFDSVAMQRLMQALGAYGYLGLVRGKKEFLRYIPVAMRLLAEVLGRIPGLEPLLAYVENLASVR
ncbi:N-acetylmuramate 1-kinase [Methylacidimicrobium cyclopophantes]|uniref:N-acetylmuramate 1-kinase n=1 Tax=Methylacidimicrobium cyclopophantes TaxID=1041766 RepID=A0A5E6M7P2_9BACT|nr:phosphotransferase [Methylacidimicrobium cyclopophantes]VVM05570.1 N-acetylmuramate 1-kinase [Methylacidimicrobium cyclopophantes]